MKNLSVSVLLCALSWGVMAQPAVSTATKTKAATRAKPARVQMAALMPEPVAPPMPLGAVELEIASRVYVGHLPCELGAAVQIAAHADVPGYFQLHLGKQTFLMAPVPTTTGAIRLEDRRAGAVWLQLANKSMLVSDRLGKRLVDACMNPGQMQVAEEIKANPMPSVLDDPLLPDGAVALK